MELYKTVILQGSSKACNNSQTVSIGAIGFFFYTVEYSKIHEFYSHVPTLGLQFMKIFSKRVGLEKHVEHERRIVDELSQQDQGASL